MQDNHREALRMLGKATRGTFNPMDMMGPGWAAHRADILTTLTGKPVVRAQAGVNALREAFYEVFKPEGDSYAAKEITFAAMAKAEIYLE